MAHCDGVDFGRCAAAAWTCVVGTIYKPSRILVAVELYMYINSTNSKHSGTVCVCGCVCVLKLLGPVTNSCAGTLEKLSHCDCCILIHTACS